MFLNWGLGSVCNIGEVLAIKSYASDFAINQWVVCQLFLLLVKPQVSCGVVWLMVLC